MEGHKVQYKNPPRRSFQRATDCTLSLKLYKTTAVPIQMYGSEECKRDMSTIWSSWSAFSEKSQGFHTVGQNDCIRNELNVHNPNQRIDDYRLKWREHVDGMDENRQAVQRASVTLEVVERENKFMWLYRDGTTIYA